MPTSFPPNRPKTTQTYAKKDRTETTTKGSPINLAPISAPRSADLEEEFEEEIIDNEEEDDGTDFLRLGKRVKVNIKPPSPIPVDSPSGSFSPSAQTIPSFLEAQNNGKSFVFIHGLPSQMTQRQSLYSPQISQSPSSDQEGAKDAVEVHENYGEKMDVERQDTGGIRSTPANGNTPVPRQSQQGASMSLFSDVKEDEEHVVDNNLNGDTRENKDVIMGEEDDDDDQSTLVVDRAHGDKSQHVQTEEEPSTRTREQSLTELMEASTLIVDTLPEAPLHRQGSRSMSKSKSSESVNTSLMSHDGNVSSAATNPLSLGSRSSNTAKLDDTTHTTSTSVGAQTSAVSSYESLSIEEKIEFIKPKMKTEEINGVDDLQKRIVIAFHDLGCDEPHLLADIINGAAE